MELIQYSVLSWHGLPLNKISQTQPWEDNCSFHHQLPSCFVYNDQFTDLYQFKVITRHAIEESLCDHDLWTMLTHQYKTHISLTHISPIFALSVQPFSLSVRLNLVCLTLLNVSGVKPLLKVKIWFAKRSLGHLLINICSVSGWGWWQTRPHLEIGWSGDIRWGWGYHEWVFSSHPGQRRGGGSQKSHLGKHWQARKHQRGGIRGLTPVCR